MSESPLTLEGLESSAAEATGLSDFGESLYREGLGVFLESLAAEGPLHENGVRVMRDLLVLRLSTRLKWVDWVAKHPEVNTATLPKPPIFIVGTPRSGTTLLYNLLSLHPDVRCPVFWEMLDTIPPAWDCDPGEVTERVAAMDEFLRDYNEGLPQFKPIHYLHSASHVEECNGLLDLTFRSPLMAFALWPGPRYYRWLTQQSEESMAQAFAEYRSLVCLLSHDTPEKTWLSKCPVAAPFTPQLKAAFPNARIVHTHRDPRERLPSFCNLNRHLHSVYREPTIDGAREQVLYYNRVAMEGIATARRAAPDDTTDINYTELVADPIASVESVCDRLELRIEESFLTACRAWLDDRNPYDAKKVGKHEYEAEELGFDLSELSALEP